VQDQGPGCIPHVLVRETRRDDGDHKDMRRMAHNPETACGFAGSVFTAAHATQTA